MKYIYLQKGVVCGVYVDNAGENFKFTPTANQINQESGGALENALKM